MLKIVVTYSGDVTVVANDLTTEDSLLPIFRHINETVYLRYRYLKMVTKMKGQTVSERNGNIGKNSDSTG